MGTKIVVGSTSRIKLSAVRRACEAIGLEAEIVGVQTDSGVPAQPVGDEETLAGAMNRALAARRCRPGAIAVGIENGIDWTETVRGSGHYFDFARIVLILPNWKIYRTKSRAVRLPVEDVEKASGSGVTVGSVIAERTGCEPDDPHAFLTEGRSDRESFLVPPLVRLLKKTLKELS